MAEEKKQENKKEIPATERSPAAGIREGGRATERSARTVEKKEELELIVRVAGVDLDGNKPVSQSIIKIKGIGIRTAKNVSIAFEKETGKNSSEKIGKIKEEDVKRLEEIVLAPAKFGVPEWSLNRRKDYETGENKHLVMADLDFSLRQDVQRLSEIKSNRGFRHTWKLPLRGQRTKSTHRGKGGIVGVTKKDIKVEKK